MARKSGAKTAALAALAAPIAMSGATAAGKPGAPAARPAPIRPAALVGRWGDNGDCRRDVVFRGDGTFRSYTGGEGTWRLAGDRLTMAGTGGSFVRTVVTLGPGRLRITGPDGSAGISQRC
jgi:hypothetical protein